MKAILGFIAVAVFIIPVCAEDTTDGNYLLGSCQIAFRTLENPDTMQNKYEAWRDGYCRGVVEGVNEASPKVCPTGGVAFGQEIRVVVRFLEDHPEKLNLRGTKLVQQALAKAFPCSK